MKNIAVVFIALLLSFAQSSKADEVAWDSFMNWGSYQNNLQNYSKALEEREQLIKEEGIYSYTVEQVVETAMKLKGTDVTIAPSSISDELGEVALKLEHSIDNDTCFYGFEGPSFIFTLGEEKSKNLLIITFMKIDFNITGETLYPNTGTVHSNQGLHVPSIGTNCVFKKAIFANSLTVGVAYQTITNKNKLSYSLDKMKHHIIDTVQKPSISHLISWRSVSSQALWDAGANFYIEGCPPTYSGQEYEIDPERTIKKYIGLRKQYWLDTVAGEIGSFAREWYLKNKPELAKKIEEIKEKQNDSDK